MPTPRRPARRLVAEAAIGTAALVIATAGCGGHDRRLPSAGLPDPALDEARDVLCLWCWIAHEERRARLDDLVRDLDRSEAAR